MSIFDKNMVPIPANLRLKMSKEFDGYGEEYNHSGIVAPVDVWDVMENTLNKGFIHKLCNGCGSASTEVVPDTQWGLCITPICNPHDVTHALSETPEDCDRSNKLFLLNNITFINNNSNFIMRIMRRYRATTYYSGVEEGKRLFCNGYKGI